MKARLADQEARDVISNALDETVVVEAAAGTGKTTELVKRILRILSTGRAEVRAIVAVTFSEKAAGELKLRLREALERERTGADGEVKQRLDIALARLEEAHVSTIHGFCAELLRERPVEAHVDPLFTVLTEGQAERLFDEAFSGWIQAQLADPPEGIRRALRRSVWSGYNRTSRADGPIDRVRRAAWELAQWRDFQAPWTRGPFDRDGDIDRLIVELHDFAALTAKPSYATDNLFLDTAAARHLNQEIALHQSFGHEDYDGWEARFVDLSRDRNFSKSRHGRGPGYGAGVTRDAVLAAFESLRSHLDQFRMAADADLAASLQQELRTAIVRYEDLKRRAGALDFLDLLLEARNLVRNNAAVRQGFQRRFTHIFVDEFQDTDPLQAELLLLLASADPAATDWRTVAPAPGRLFIVGDPKQSIYRFRRADVGIYREVCERLEKSGARIVKLTTSFRSAPEIQACVNAAFAPVMTGDTFTLQASYVPLSPFRQGHPRQPAVVALPVPKPYGMRNISAVAIESSLPDAVGAYVDWLVNDSRWKVTERTGDKPVPLQAQHICILFRRFISFGDDVTMPYAHALEARGVKHVLVGGKTFHEREEVESLRAALAAIEWPDDELSVFATLRGPLFAIGDEELLDWRQRYGRFLPTFVPQDARENAAVRPIVDALGILKSLHRERNRLPAADTIHKLLHVTRAHVGLVLRPAGEQALANVLHVAELARQYEANGGISFRGFVDELRIAAETAQAAEAPILEEGSDGVRMMTVHKAKGLEFPVVILADVTCRLSRTDAGRWIDGANNMCALKIGGWAPIDLLLHDAEESARDKAESERLTYVAATRARDLLVVPTIGDGPYEGGWLDPLTSAIYPPDAQRRSPQHAEGCPPFRSKDSVVNRPGMDPARQTTVAPGSFVFAPRTEHSAPSTEHSALITYRVTWWDPSILHLNAPSSFGLRRDDLIVKDGDRLAVEDRLAEYERWRAEREGLLEQGSVPSLRIQTATAWAVEAATLGIDDAIAAASGIEVVHMPGAERRPRGPRFGTLVHAVLAIVPLDADEEIILRTADVQARIINSPREEVVAAAHAVRAVLKHELMVRARASSRVRRETPITWMQKDGTLIEGILDLAFDEEGLTTVIDFKTDHELSAGEARYRAQLQKYVDAVAAATERRVAGVLFKV